MDPGTALSVISLGIQCSQGILHYYESYRGRNVAVKTMWDSAEALAKTFAIIDETVRNSDDAELVSQITANIDACQEHLQTLRKKLDKIRDKTPASASFGDKAHHLGQRVLYPFKESTLAKLKETIQDLRDNLTVALAGLQLRNNKSMKEALKTLAIDFHDVNTGLQTIQCNLEQSHQDEIRDKALNWLNRLSSVDVASNHSTARKNREQDTGGWFLESNEYKSWKTSPGSRLWINGNPGCGKTVICSSIVDDLLEESRLRSESVVAFFYFSFAEGRTQSCTSLLSSILAQICQGRPLPQCVQELHDRHQQTRPTIDELSKAILAVLMGLGRTYIVIDALDECPGETEGRERGDILEWLNNVFCSDSCDLHIIVSSRKERDIRHALSSIPEWPSISITKESNSGDIALYIKMQLSTDARLRNLDDATKMNVEDTLVNRADGMFRWVFCQLEELKKLKLIRPRYVQSVLRSLPPTLDETYERILLGLESCHQEVLAALTWLTYSKTPLSAKQLAEACIIEPDNATPVVDEERILPEEILQLLSSLVVEKATERRQDKYDLMKEIRLAHFSVKEYLVSDRIRKSQACSFSIESGLAKVFIAKSCIAYITYYSESPSKASNNDDILRFPLMRHACKYWDCYCLDCENQSREEIMDIATQRLTSDSWRTCWGKVRGSHPCAPGFFDDFPAPPLHCAVGLGLDEVIERLLENVSISDIDAHYFPCGSALHTAVSFPRPRAVKLLLEAGADVNVDSGCIGTPLHLASKDISAQLIAYGADVNATNGANETALSVAMKSRNQDKMELLVDAGADVNAIGGYWGSPLNLAAARGEEEYVRMLCENGADPNLRAPALVNFDLEVTPIQATFLDVLGKMIHARSPLKIIPTSQQRPGSETENSIGALKRAHDNELKGANIIKVLLDHGANANEQAVGEFGTPLQMASCSGDISRVERLLSHGADVNAACVENFGTALQAAAIRGSPEVVELLLTHGAEVNSQDRGQFGTALQAASLRGESEIVKLLIAKGADVHAEGRRFGTAIEAARLCLFGDNSGVIEILRNHGARLAGE